MSEQKIKGYPVVQIGSVEMLDATFRWLIMCCVGVVIAVVICFTVMFIQAPEIRETMMHVLAIVCGFICSTILLVTLISANS